MRVRLLGEDLIAFRDTDGEVGLVDAFCPHRRAPMFFGRNEECGLRCVYHGWKFDRNGACVDMPSEPPDSLFKTKVTIEAYPTWEGGGIVWAYMGPPELQPPPPDYELVRAPATHRHVSKTFEDCNYLQALEGGLDTAHSSFLHNENIGDQHWFRNARRARRGSTSRRTDYGYTYAGDPRRSATTSSACASITTSCRRSRCAAASPASTAAASQDARRSTATSGCRSTTSTPGRLQLDVRATIRTIPITHEYATDDETRSGRGPDDSIPGTFQLKRTCANDYLIDRAGAEDEDVHRHRRHQHPGHRAARRHGPDRRPLERASRHDRPRDHRRCVSCCSKPRARSSAARRRAASIPQTYRNVRPYDAVVPRKEPGKGLQNRSWSRSSKPQRSRWRRAC